MPIWIFLALIWIHFVADFVFQSDKMAINKSTSINWLTKHAFAYGIVFFVVGVLVMLFLPYWGLPIPLVYEYIMLWAMFSFFNMSTHFMVDYITSKITTYYWNKEKRHAFFVTIGIDQAIHLTILFLTFTGLFLA